MEFYLVLGLGNPGLKYKKTRHNAGFVAVEMLAKKHGIKLNKKKHDGVFGIGEIEGKPVIIAKPTTYMNLSGYCAVQLADYYDVKHENIIVVYDDIDLPEGKLRLKNSGSAGSHNGMKSIIQEIDSKNFPRVRIGVGRNPEYMDLAHYVLQKQKGEVLSGFYENCERAASATECILGSGLSSAQGRFNS